MPLEVLLSRVLWILGIGFLLANLRVFLDFLRFRRLRSSALLTWPGRRPGYYSLWLALGVVLGGLIVYKLFVQHRPPVQLFGESMMFVYYGYALPLSLRIGRGLYADGIWGDQGFLRYGEIGGLRWREGDQITLVFIHRARRVARSLSVPSRHYAAVRRLLRDRIAAHDIQLAGAGLGLGAHDEREDV